MKRLIALFLILMMIFSLTACGNEDKGNGNNKKDRNNTTIADVSQDDNSKDMTISIESVKNAKETDASLFEYEDIDGGISITKYNGNNEIVCIPEKIDGKSVVYIGRSAFANCSTILGFKLSDSVTLIDENAFINCDGMKVFVSGKSLQTIAKQAFGNCSSLFEIDLNEGLIEIGLSCFGFTGLEKIEIPSSVTKIDGPFIKNVDKELLVIGETGSSIEQYVKENGAEYNLKFQAK
ncbi:MAG: leucine-rich repeat domain-containing protein [Clostridia bacterium]|nr:leucine-rich repeat domain-containing protein [Clostridia bacterium]